LDIAGRFAHSLRVGLDAVERRQRALPKSRIIDLIEARPERTFRVQLAGALEGPGEIARLLPLAEPFVYGFVGRERRPAKRPQLPGDRLCVALAVACRKQTTLVCR